MSKESYIERLQRERAELIDYIQSCVAFDKAFDVLNTTGRKGSAYKAVEAADKIKKEKFKQIAQYLSE